MAEAKKTSDEDDDLDVVCFEHCNHKVFALSGGNEVELPKRCPECGSRIEEEELNPPPFRLPSPLSRAQDHPCSVVIKPTKGCFLRDFVPGDNLHVAITNSKGFVIEYDKAGVHRDKTLQWNNCLVVDFRGVNDEILCDPDWSEYWDTCLEENILSSEEEEWTADTYEEEGRNCLAFVLTFLRSLRTEPISSEARSKVTFCERYVVPRTRVASKYIWLYRKLLKSRTSSVAVKEKEKEQEEEDRRRHHNGSKVKKDKDDDELSF